MLLLNTTMTVQRGNAASHANAGWQPFTDRVIRGQRAVRKRGVPAVGLACPEQAEADRRHSAPVLKSVHPSPLSAYRGFFGCGHFSRTNSFLEQRGLAPINWSLPPL